MIEQYIYDKITGDATLQSLLSDGSSGYQVYPNVVPRGKDVNQAVTFTLVNTSDVYPDLISVNIQFNIFAQTHAKISEIAQAISDLFNEDNNQKEDAISVVYSQRISETDLGFDYDSQIYQREATYYFKLR